MKISSNNYVGFPHMFHVDMLDDSSPNCVDGTDSSPWFTLNKNQGLGFLGLGSVNDWSPWTSKWIWKNKRCEDEIFEYTVYIYMRGAHSKAVLSGWANSTKMSSWSAFLVSQIWLLDLSVCYVCCFFIIMHGGVDEFFPQLLIPGPSRWFAVLDCTTCYLDKLLVSELLWFSQTWKSATLKSYEIDPIWTS